MTLSGSGSIDDHITFTGTFTDGNTVFDCSPAVLSVCTGSQSNGEIEVTFGNLKLNQSQSASVLSNAKVTLSGYNSKYSVRIMVDGGASYITDYSISSSFLSKTLTMNLSSLTPGKHVISIGFVSPGGDVQSYNLYVRYDGTNVIFSTEW
jgi:hypothetical protein